MFPPNVNVGLLGKFAEYYAAHIVFKLSIQHSLQEIKFRPDLTSYELVWIVKWHHYSLRHSMLPYKPQLWKQSLYGSDLNIAKSAEELLPKWITTKNTNKEKKCAEIIWSHLVPSLELQKWCKSLLAALEVIQTGVMPRSIMKFGGEKITQSSIIF